MINFTVVTDSHRTLCGKRRYMSELLYKTLRESVVNAIRTKIMKRQIRPRRADRGAGAGTGISYQSRTDS